MADADRTGSPCGMPRTPLRGALQEQVPARLRDYRHRRGFTQEKLAELAGVKPETISRIENGRAQPSIMVLARLTSALECAMGDILDESSLAGDEGEVELLLLWRSLGPRARAGLLELLRHR